MSWGWPQWVVAGWMAFNIVISTARATIKDDGSRVTPTTRAGWFTGALIGSGLFYAGLAYVLAAGGFWGR